jgi:hypothetical protein
MKAGIDRTTLREVLEATQMHLRALRATRRRGRVDGSLDDVIEGLGISADKLRLAIKDAGRRDAPACIVVSVAGGAVTAVMCDREATARVFGFDRRVQELANGEFRDEPNSGKAADKADREFHDATKGMADALAAAAERKVKR